MQRRDIVSFPSEQLILVDDDDNSLGEMSKTDCHLGDGILHRAFSVFLVDSSGAVLMQKRSADKPLWPLYWSNSCCSHPRVGESMDVAIRRRMHEELGVACKVSFVYKFQYQANYEDVGSENELCSVYVGYYNGSLSINESEIAEVRHFSVGEIDEQLTINADQFTPWFKMEWTEIRKLINESNAAGESAESSTA